MVKIPSVIFGLVVPARSKENYMPLSMLDRQMNKLEMGKTILEESNGLPISALREILDFVCFIKSKRMDEGRMELADNAKRELSELDKASLTHLEAEFIHHPAEKTYRPSFSTCFCQAELSSIFVCGNVRR